MSWSNVPVGRGESEMKCSNNLTESRLGVDEDLVPGSPERNPNPQVRNQATRFVAPFLHQHASWPHLPLNVFFFYRRRVCGRALPHSTVEIWSSSHHLQAHLQVLLLETNQVVYYPRNVGRNDLGRWRSFLPTNILVVHKCMGGIYASVEWRFLKHMKKINGKWFHQWNMVVRFLQGTAKQRLPTVDGKHRSEAKVYGFSFHAFSLTRGVILVGLKCFRDERSHHDLVTTVQ